MQSRILVTAAVSVLTSAAFGMHESRSFINADDVHAQGMSGHGVTVAVIDTGIDYTHPGLSGSIAAGGLSIEGGVIQPDMGEDVYSLYHGTYMSLIITDPWGVAPGAKILSIRVHGPSGGANPTDVMLGILYAMNRSLTADPSIRVINRSGGMGAYQCSCDAWWPAYNQVISDAFANGIITFAATGNEAVCGGISMPACFSSAVPVAANYDADWYPGQYFEPPADCADLNPERYRVVCFSNATDNCGHFLAAPGFSITVGDSPETARRRLPPTAQVWRR
ncbi:MAG TPA: S8/S53 family peptidase [Phycisphaerae bacterium]|nr:S8/S53 family peptidase [Phycisphaerae bacterium]HRR87367.1 S8/S53 family peptidase [Phycisphaerae bacterium]